MTQQQFFQLTESLFNSAKMMLGGRLIKAQQKLDTATVAPGF